MYAIRRFSDFFGLHEKLVMRYQSRGIIVPPPPEKSVIGMHFYYNSPNGADVQLNNKQTNRQVLKNVFQGLMMIINNLPLEHFA